MPFLRAALLRKQREQEKISPPVEIIVEESEPVIEEVKEEFTDFDSLHRLIDTHAEEFEANNDEDISEPETISELAPSFDSVESDSVGDVVSEVPAEEPEPEPEITEPVEEIFSEVQEEEPEPDEIIFTPESEQEIEAEPEIFSEEISQEPEPIPEEIITEEISPGEPEPTSEPEELPEIISEELEEFSQEQETDAEPVTEDFSEPEEISQEEPEESPEPEPQEEPVTEEEEETTPELPEIISEAVAEEESEPEPQPDDEPAPEEFKLKYDFTSGERYVDSVSTKTEFDKMLDELANISKELLSWQTEKFARDYTSKFQGDFDKAEADAKKYAAFLGGYITNAAMTLYDNGYKDAAIKQLEQAKSILETKMKLEAETEAIKSRVEENDDSVDLSDILGLFGDA